VLPLVRSCSVLHLLAWRSPCSGKKDWRVSPIGFGMVVLLEFQADEKTMLWSKLAFLGPFALTGTASDMDKQGLFADSAWRARLESAVGEACAVAVADGAVVDGGKILATLASLPATMHSSMQKDVSAGRMPELDAIGGPILRRGERYNLKLAVTREMVARIQDRLSTLHRASAS
jgi:2-dehydropantoate 2-reductase